MMNIHVSVGFISSQILSSPVSSLIEDFYVFSGAFNPLPSLYHDLVEVA